MARPKKTAPPTVVELSEGGVTRSGLIRHPIRLMPLSMLKPAAYNPRRITDHAKVGLRNTIEKFGMVQAIVWNERSGNVVGGHQRLDALIAMGEEDAEVTVVDLSHADEVALNLSLNNPATQGTWDDDLMLKLRDDIGSIDSVLIEDTRLDELLKQFSAPDDGEEEHAFGSGLPDEQNVPESTPAPVTKCPACGSVLATKA